ncbi:MAG: ABC transporter ATP-binding protein, partial [Lachnospiraceae bacterium]|nr:ABC transporter ATP-binding protein [Lachnospiraceae bacterium]
MTPPVISFQDYSFQYMAQAEPTLRHINLDIYPGEKVLIAGASGSGKSTIGNCINGLIPFAYPGKSTGKLLVDGVETEKSSIFELSHTVGTVLQDTDGQFIGLTVGEDIAFAPENDCVPQEEMKQLVDKVAGLVDIDHHLEYAPQELSGGQKQRVSLAGVMVEDVKVLLFDEPLANLDPAAGRSTIELIDMVHERTKAAVLIIEHRLEDVLWRSMDRIILMNEGEIVADMPVADLLAGDLLLQHGIREPLYLTALRYAGVEISKAMQPEHVDHLVLGAKEKEKVQNWFKEQKAGIHTAQHGDELLRVEDLKFGYTPDKYNLQDINFTIHKGEMVSIVGRNGAGKSTMAKLICGFEKPVSGAIYMEGRNLEGDTIKERAARIGYVMQNPNQMISKPMIWDEVEMALVQSGMSREERTKRVEETLKVCGLYAFRNWPVSALSFGQKKRVTIASILVQRPQVIILDEPTAGQD